MKPGDDERENGAPFDPDSWPGADKRQNAFLNAYVANYGRVGAAAKAAKISRGLHYKWLRLDENYRSLFAEAGKQAAEALEDEARRRAKEGVIEVVYYQGVKCGTVVRYSDSLMMFLLRGLMSDKYQPKQQGQLEVFGPGGGAIQIEFIDPPERKPDA